MFGCYSWPVWPDIHPSINRMKQTHVVYSREVENGTQKFFLWGFYLTVWIKFNTVPSRSCLLDFYSATQLLNRMYATFDSLYPKLFRNLLLVLSLGFRQFERSSLRWIWYGQIHQWDLPRSPCLVDCRRHDRQLSGEVVWSLSSNNELISGISVATSSAVHGCLKTSPWGGVRQTTGSQASLPPHPRL